MHETPSTPTEKMSRYRQRLKEKGLRPVQIWVPDTRNITFINSLQKELASLHPGHEEEALAFIEKASDFDHWQ